uniref:Uncharacterized protein n=1 Tax=Pristionchus pacificus TaxID=54126 RepID=A0A2A6BCZ1_PRIPA|eukprot:PDM63738.1 hypothetical protein PRIPAC_49711 [Pristionchus pacificus]
MDPTIMTPRELTLFSLCFELRWEYFSLRRMGRGHGVIVHFIERLRMIAADIAPRIEYMSLEEGEMYRQYIGDIHAFITDLFGFTY